MARTVSSREAAQVDYPRQAGEKAPKNKKPRNKLKDKMAQIRFLYEKYDDPMPTSFYEAQDKWLKKYERKNRVDTSEERKALEYYYLKHYGKLDAKGRAPPRPDRRRINREKRKREKQRERNEEQSEEEEQPRPKRIPMGKNPNLEEYFKNRNNNESGEEEEKEEEEKEEEENEEEEDENDPTRMLEDIYMTNVRVVQALVKAMEASNMVREQLEKMQKIKFR